ncbi:Protein fam72a [Mortierella polycephala]|uniref:Protein fam72a n=1 Tax=Mortierella polycephala TaxID=41804 RepID=A0A9P6U030_9FUNG|nr:Protein fam72a [Mortierella polycephala]
MSPSLHPQFRAKAVCRLTCKSCLSDVCMRGMKAILLADSRVELYSTDRAPRGVQLVYDDYRTRSCKCRICDVACLGCGNTLGYHVTQPCEPCLEACNNGHFWMFHSDGVSCTERYLPKTYSTRASLSRSRTSASTPSSSSSSSSYSYSYSSTSSSLLSGPLSTSSCALVPLPDATSQSQNRHRRRRRRTRQTELGSRVTTSTTATTTTSTTTQPTEHDDLSFRRRTSIHDIEYNRAVNSNRGSSGGHGTNGSEYSDDNDEDFHPDSAENDSEDGDVEDSNEGESEFDGCDDSSDESGDDDDEEEEEEEGEEEEEEKPVVMLWAALHAQEERYLQQMQQQLLIQQQQQLIQQQRIQEQQRRREALEQGLELGPVQGQQQDESLSNSPGLQSQTQSLSIISPPAAGSRYHSMISTAISNASMMLWDEGRAQNQYDSFVAR